MPLILDHVNGNNLDNSPKNLRYVCPNCDAQLPTRGEANRGRVHEALEGSYILMSRNEKREYYVIPNSPGQVVVTGYAATLRYGKTSGESENR